MSFTYFYQLISIPVIFTEFLVIFYFVKTERVEPLERFGKNPFGSKSSRFHKHSAVKSLRLPLSRHIVPSERIHLLYLFIFLIIVYQGAPTPTHSKDYFVCFFNACISGNSDNCSNTKSKNSLHNAIYVFSDIFKKLFI